MSLLELSEKEFKEKVEIQFKSISEGFDKYKSLLLSPKETKNFQLGEDNYIDLIKNLYNLNNQNLIVDFYISNLSNEEYKTLYNSLDEKDKYTLELIKNKNFSSSYFVVNDESIIDFLVRLCTKEMFFVTFYFTSYPLTIWGNYNLKFPMFYKKEESIHYLEEILNKINLNLEK